MPPASPAKRARDLADDRWSYLQDCFAPPSVDVHLRLMAELLAFLKRDGCLAPTPYEVVPQDIVRFFIMKDHLGRTKVHLGECDWWGVSRNAPCACPTRLAVATIRSQRSSLQGCFRDLGLRTPWQPLRASGNPCSSAIVDQYISCVEREHAAAGVETIQAALVDVSIFDRILQATLSDWADAPPASASRAAAARDAFFYSLLWHSGFRCADALRLHFCAIRLFDNSVLPGLKGPIHASTGPGMSIDVTRSKTVSAPSGARRTTIWDGVDPVPTSTCLGLYLSELRALGFVESELRGPLFRKVLLTEEGTHVFGGPCTWNDMSSAYVRHLARAGLAEPALARHISLHSFHGSRAARERAAGVPAADTCQAMGWSLEMYNHYCEGREPLTLDGISTMLPMPPESCYQPLGSVPSSPHA